MPRLFAAVAALLLAGPAGAAPPAGRWKLRLPQGDDTLTFLVAFTDEGGKWGGEFLSASARLRQDPTVAGVVVDGSAVRFRLSLAGRDLASFDGVAGKDGKKLSGSLSVFNGPLQLTDLYPSDLKKVDDPADLAREDAAQLDGGAGLFNAAFAVFSQAEGKKVPPAEVRQLADKLAKAAAGYGPRWELTVAQRTAGLLAGQKPYADTALAQARRAERLLPEDAPAGEQAAALGTLARALSAAGKADEAAKYAARVQKLEAQEYAEYQKTGLGFAPARFPGRKAKSDRVAVVEVFTGAECPPCVAVDLATDGVLQAYPGRDVVLLNYHIHVPAPDALASPDGMDRLNQYGDRVTGAPAVFVNGKPGPQGGGPAAAAKQKHGELRKVIDAELEAPAAVKLLLTATPAGDGFTVTASAKPTAGGDKLALRFALVEEVVRYPGGNGVKFHSRVVRAMPGGAAGFPVPKGGLDKAVTVDPAAVRKALAEYLADPTKTDGDLPRVERPLDLKGLSVVAFVQDDATGEVLQAAEVKLGAK